MTDPTTVPRHLPVQPQSPRATNADIAEEALRTMVLTGQLGSGSRLNEVSLAASLGVSRGPLREAIQRLTAEGLLTVVRHKGAYVRTVSGAELEELYELRVVLETFAVRLVVRKARQRDITALLDLVRLTRQALAGDGTAYPPDLDFHQHLVAVADNPVLSRAARDVYHTIHLARARSAHDPARAQSAFEEHCQILTAIVARDGEQAARLLADHLRSSLRSARALIRQTAVTDGPAVG